MNLLSDEFQGQIDELHKLVEELPERKALREFQETFREFQEVIEHVQDLFDSLVVAFREILEAILVVVVNFIAFVVEVWGEYERFFFILKIKERFRFLPNSFAVWVGTSFPLPLLRWMFPK